VDAVVLKPGEGEALFDGRIVLKASFDRVTITESHFPDARDGAEPHFHRRHVDSFYVLEGGMAVLVHDEEKLLEQGAFASVPPEVVHGFRTTSRSVFLNFHTPDGDFADHLRARNRSEKGGFDSVDAAPGGGKPPTEAVFWRPGEGERLESNNRVATIKLGREELALIEFELDAGFEGPDPHSHDDHVDSFYVLEGEVDFLVGDEWLRLPARSFVAAPIGVTHAFANRDGQHARLLNIHAPSTGFHDRLRGWS
jgi:quercetin dioxygenase-like cupin family protein